MKTKTVQFSYPTSTNAKKFGFYKEGCWCVEFQEGNDPPEAIQGFPSRDSALHAARYMNHLPWSPLFIQFHPEDAK